MARLDIDWDAQPLGELPDERLANILGCSRGAVFHQRRKRSIAPWRPRHRVWSRSQAALGGRELDAALDEIRPTDETGGG